MTANQNDYNPPGMASASVLQMSSDAARAISGLAGGTDGRLVALINVGNQPLMLLDESAASLASNRFTLGGSTTISAKQAAMLRYDGIAARWQALARPTGGREVLTGNRIYYVRTDGNDANNGFSNAAGGAFLTAQRAYAVICTTLDLAGFTVTIQFGNGTYGGGVTLSTGWIGCGTVEFLGDLTTPSNVVFSRSSANIFTCPAPLAGTLSLRGIKLITTTSGSGIAVTSSGVLVSFDRLEFGACASLHMQVSAPGSMIRGVSGGSYLVSGGSSAHFQAVGGGQIQVTGMAVTLLGAPAFPYAFADAELGGIIQVQFWSFTGSATGRRYIAATGGLLSTGGGSATYFPGDTAGAGSSLAAAPYGMYS